MATARRCLMRLSCHLLLLFCADVFTREGEGRAAPLLYLRIPPLPLLRTPPLSTPRRPRSDQAAADAEGRVGPSGLNGDFLDSPFATRFFSGEWASGPGERLQATTHCTRRPLGATPHVSSLCVPVPVARRAHPQEYAACWWNARQSCIPGWMDDVSLRLRGGGRVTAKPLTHFLSSPHTAHRGREEPGCKP